MTTLGAYLEENDIDGRLSRPQFRIPDEFTDMEINSTGVFSAVGTEVFSRYLSSHLYSDIVTHIDEITFTYRSIRWTIYV